MIPLYKKLKESENLQPILVSTGQHREMLNSLFELFEVKPDVDLDIMKKGQDLTDITTRVLLSMRYLIKSVEPSLILVHGDTTTAFASALAGFYNGVEIGHIEAGLRTYNLKSPYPEEFNRQGIDRMAKYFFCPTETSKDNLEQEVLNKGSELFVTGNTVIDALLEVAGKVEAKEGRPYILVTGHRRENFGFGFEQICTALKEIVRRHKDFDIVYPVHLNPNVHDIVYMELATEENVKLMPPQDYKKFVALMKGAYLILTDSGGVQEEAPSLGKPVLVMRDTTERPEALEAGTVKLVGTNYGKIIQEVEILLTNKAEYEKMSKAINPYGDGKACERIKEIIEKL